MKSRTRRRVVIGLALSAGAAAVWKWLPYRKVAQKPVRLLSHDGTLQEVDHRHVRVKGKADQDQVKRWIWNA